MSGGLAVLGFQRLGFGFKLLWFGVAWGFLACGHFLKNKISSGRKKKVGARYFYTVALYLIAILFQRGPGVFCC